MGRRTGEWFIRHIVIMISAPISHRGMLYQGAYYPALVGASMSSLPSRNPGAVSTVKPAYDVSFAKEAMNSTINSPIPRRAPLAAKAAFQPRPVIGGSNLGPEGLGDNGVQSVPYSVTQANRAYQQTIQGL